MQCCHGAVPPSEAWLILALASHLCGCVPCCAAFCNQTCCPCFPLSADVRSSPPCLPSQPPNMSCSAPLLALRPAAADTMSRTMAISLCAPLLETSPKCWQVWEACVAAVMAVACDHELAQAVELLVAHRHTIPQQGAPLALHVLALESRGRHGSCRRSLAPCASASTAAPGEAQWMGRAALI